MIKTLDFNNIKPASIQDIENAEKELGLKFSNEYKELLKKYGAIEYNGHEFTGLCVSKYKNVINSTKTNWDLNLIVPHNMYVIEDTHIDGIVIWQDNNGIIYESRPEYKTIKKVALSLYDYIKNNIVV